VDEEPHHAAVSERIPTFRRTRSARSFFFGVPPLDPDLIVVSSQITG
jgi:hypothetical protein